MCHCMLPIPRIVRAIPGSDSNNGSYSEWERLLAQHIATPAVLTMQLALHRRGGRAILFLTACAKAHNRPIEPNEKNLNKRNREGEEGTSNPHIMHIFSNVAGFRGEGVGQLGPSADVLEGLVALVTTQTL